MGARLGGGLGDQMGRQNVVEIARLHRQDGI
jgi:hypothetical protein